MTGENVLVLDGVVKRYGRVEAVAGVSLRIGAGELVTMVGPSGCGKSSLLRLVAGLERPDAGEVHLAGRTVAGPRTWVPPERRRVGIVFQDHALFPHLTVAGNVAFGLDGAPTAGRRARVTDVLDLVALGHLAERYPHELSGGEQQRVALARALAPEPDVLLLDEPFSNLDRALRLQVRAETVAILRATRTTAVFVTHDQPEALTVGDRVVVLRGGRIQQAGDPQTVFHAPANHFVATFMGDADFLPAHRDGSSLHTEIGTVPGDPDGTGDALEVVLRPHEVALQPDAAGAATVVGREFLGAFHLVTVQLPSGRSLRSLQPHTVTFDPGDRVAVNLTIGHRPAVLPARAAGGAVPART
ncbi:ABC transporter ATP-binding protein [Pseudonocardia nigra]|uniref:ABC transporter ATP-binding protein n=1 Tax=Pseudonocardia nigra TaxID=1921578 RepID=UPI001C5F090D|nr:ABC transporter ATP-binding protein [Pseudonocardia nigra]